MKQKVRHVENNFYKDKIINLLLTNMIFSHELGFEAKSRTCGKKLLQGQNYHFCF